MSTTRTKIKWEASTTQWQNATGKGFTWDEVALIQEITHGDSEPALDKLSDEKKKKLVRLIMRRKGIKHYDEYKEVTNISARVKDVKLIIKEVKKQVEVSHV